MVDRLRPRPPEEVWSMEQGFYCRSLLHGKKKERFHGSVRGLRQ